MAWTLTILAGITYTIYIYYIPTGMKHCKWETFVVAEQQAETLVGTVSALILYKWYEHMPTVWIVLVSVGFVLAILLALVYLGYFAVKEVREGIELIPEPEPEPEPLSEYEDVPCEFCGNSCDGCEGTVCENCQNCAGPF